MPPHVSMTLEQCAAGERRLRLLVGWPTVLILSSPLLLPLLVCMVSEWLSAKLSNLNSRIDRCIIGSRLALWIGDRCARIVDWTDEPVIAAKAAALALKDRDQECSE